MANPQMKFRVLDDSVDIFVPLTSQGKFRCKVRDDFQKYGSGIAPKTTKIPRNAYIEWQIGYDCKLDDNKKITTLKHLVFTGAKGIKKNPYELSEILYNLCKLKLISKNEIDLLIDYINKMHDFLKDIFEIQSEAQKKVKINDEEFFKSVITLPTFNKTNSSCGITSEITIQKQQYATGIQPMLYINIPVSEFENGNNIIGNTSLVEKYGVLKINKSKTDVIKNIFMCFGMCSTAHHHDVLEILNLIRKNI